MRLGILLTCEKQLRWPHHFTKRGAKVHKTTGSLTPPLFIEAPVSSPWAFKGSGHILIVCVMHGYRLRLFLRFFFLIWNPYGSVVLTKLIAYVGVILINELPFISKLWLWWNSRGAFSFAILPTNKGWISIFSFLVLWCVNDTFHNISVISWRSVLLVRAVENHLHLLHYVPVANHWQTLSHNVVLSTPPHERVRSHNVRNDRHWLHR